MPPDTNEKKSDNTFPETETTEQCFSRRLTILSEVTNELSKQKSLDELHRRTVELGREKLDLDRLTLLFISSDRKSLQGSFGVDTNGAITDERDASFPIEPTSRIQCIIKGEKLILHYADAPLYLNGKIVGNGSRILAGLWDGERVIGFMTVDNLIRKRPFTDRDEEFVRLFAIAVGHLCTLKTAEKERKNLQAQLLQAQKMESVGRLAGGVAHDFNNMLGVIIGLTELATYKLAPDHPVKADLDEIREAAHRSAGLTSQLLAFARKQVALPKAVDLNVTAPELITMFSRLFGPEIEVDWQPGYNLWTVLLDPVQFDQVLANLCVNARDAITNYGHIGISTENVTLDETFCKRFDSCVPGEFVLLTVKDDGSGMSEAVKSHLFEPFFTTKELGRGTGLGLATVYGIVRQNNGRIRVESTPGNGTIFFIYFPRHITPELPVVKTSPFVEIKITGSETILLVEDEPALLDLNRRYLELQGYRVLCAKSPENGLQIADEYKEKIDLLLTDVIMPGMNGHDLARKLTILRPDIKLLFTSGFASDVITGDIMKDPRLNFLQKPYSMNVLGARVRSILGS